MCMYVCTCIHACMHACMHAYIHTYIHEYTLHAQYLHIGMWYRILTRSVNVVQDHLVHDGMQVTCEASNAEKDLQPKAAVVQDFHTSACQTTHEA